MFKGYASEEHLDTHWQGTIRLVWIIPLLVAVMLCAYGCNDDITKPKPTQEVLYLGAWHGSAIPQEYRIYAFDACTLDLRDSLIVESMPLEIVASTDGAGLYVQGDKPDLRKIDAKTGSMVWTRAGIHWPRLLAGGNLLVTAGTSPAVIDMNSGATITLLPDSLELAYGPLEGTELAAIVLEEPAGNSGDTVITVLDCATNSTRGRFVPHIQGQATRAIYYARLHPDGVHVLVIAIRSVIQESWFVIGNVETGETVLTHRLVYPFGDVMISPDGSLAAVTDPSRALIWDSYQTLDIFDLHTLTHVKRFDQFELILGVGQTRFLRDGRSLLTAHGVPLGGGPLYRIDLQSLGIVDSALYPTCDSVPFFGTSCTENGAMAIGVTQGVDECDDR